MANTFPVGWRDCENQAEITVLDFLERLPQDYVVRHDYHWQPRSGSNSPAMGQSDLILLIPQKGILVIEVKGSHRFENQDGKHKIFNQEFPNGEFTKCPFKQASDNLAEIKHDIKSFLGNDEDFQIEYAVIFPNAEKNDCFVKDKKFERRLFCKNDMGNVKAFLGKCHSLFTGGSFTDSQFAKAKGCLESSLEIANDASSISLRNLAFIRSFTECKEDLIATFAVSNNKMIITGPARSGVSRFALATAKRLARKNDRGLPVVYLCCKETFAGWIRKNNADSGVEIDSCHLFLIRQNDRHKIGNYNITIENWYLNLLDDMYNSGKKPFFDSIIFDQAQEFDARVFRKFERLVRQDGKIFFFCDSDQMLFRPATIPGDLTHHITDRCNGTKSIFRMADKILSSLPNSPANPVFTVSEHLSQGSTPLIHAVQPDTDTRIMKVKEILKKLFYNGASASHIAILTQNNDDNISSKLDSVDIQANGGTKSVPVLGGISGNFVSHLDSWMNNESIIWSTIAQFKGIEAKHILIYDFSFYSNTDPALNNCSKEQLYFGITSALESAHIFPRDSQTKAYLDSLLVP